MELVEGTNYMKSIVRCQDCGYNGRPWAVVLFTELRRFRARTVLYRIAALVYNTSPIEAMNYMNYAIRCYDSEYIAKS